MFVLINCLPKKPVLTRKLRVKIDSAASTGGQTKLIYFKHILQTPLEIEL
jgi:hypothetical protein